MKANIFAQHPAGFRLHFEIDDSRIPVEEQGEVLGTNGAVNRLVAGLGILTKWMVEHGYTGEYVAQAQTNGPAAPSEGTAQLVGPPCGQCNGPTEFKTGKRKDGGMWKAWACLKTKDAPKNAKHPFMWIDD